MRSKLLVLLFTIISSSGFAQIDQEFWFGAPDLTQGTQGEINGGAYRDRPIQLVLSTLVDPAQITIWQPANLSFQPIVVNLGPSSTQSVNLTQWLNQIETRFVDSVMTTGILVRSTAPITAYYELGAVANRDIIALKGKNANGTLFYTPFQNLWENDQSLGGSPYIPAPRSGFVIIATDDSTTVTITPTIDIVNHAAGVPFSIYLHRGQTYYCEAIDQTAAAKPAGTKVESDRPIAITIKDDMIDLNLATDGGADLAGDQIIPVEQCGFKHIVVRGDLTNPGDKVYVLATEDNTDILIDGSATPVTTLNTGEQYIYSFTAAAGFIEGSKPIYVLHISGVGDQIAGAIIPSLECTGSNQVGFTRTGNQNFKLNLTIKAGSEDQFVLNGSSAIITAADFQPVPGSNGEWVYMRKSMSTTDVPVGQGSLLTNFSEELFHMGITYQQGASCNYGYFTNFSYLELGLNRELCLGDTTILDAGPGKTSYMWSTGDTTQKITVFTPGTYYVTTLSGNECSASDTVNVSYYQPAATIQASRDTICEGASLLLNVPGVFLFEWQDGSTDPFYIADDAGIYYVDITDFQGCKSRDSIQIWTSPRPESPVASIIPFDPSITSHTVCAGQPVAMQMSSLAGATYSWLGPNNALYSGQNLTLSPIEENLAGNYMAFYTVAGCESFFDTLSIIVNPSPEVYIGLSDTLCDESSLILNAGSGAGYTYLWQDNSIEQTFEVIESGTYWVEVTNLLGCARRDSVDLTFSFRPPTPTLSTMGLDVDSDTLCVGENLQLEVPISQLMSYNWTGPSGTVQTTNNQFTVSDIQMNQAGTYYAFYIANGCPSIPDSVVISVLESPEFDFGFTDSTLCGEGQVFLSAESVNDVTYSWQDNSTDPTFVATTTGQYTVQLENSNGCRTVASVNITFNPYPETPSISGDLSVCEGSDLILNSNEQTDVVYTWTGPGVNTNGGVLTVNSATEAQEGSYTLTASLNGCLSEPVSAMVVINSLPVVNLGDDLVACKGAEITIEGPEGFATYTWSNDDETSSTSVGAGTYTLTVTDDNECANSDEITVTESGPNADFGSIPATGSQVDAAISFTDQSTGNPVSWSWSFGDNGAANTQNASHAYASQGEFTVILTVTDVNSCSDSESRTYTISNSVAVPNSFTPNGDGFNDLFVVKGLDAFPNSKMIIFNRWGSEIFNTDSYANNWDAGKYPDGTYFYILELSTGESMKGDVTVKRK
jgi:gliding motility-associated-like protein